MNWTKRNKIILGVLVLGLLGAFVAYKIIYKPHAVIEEQTAAFVGAADAFKTDVVSNQEKWLNGIVEINGKVTDVDEKGIMLNETIYCQFKNSIDLKSLSTGNAISIKGRFIGYDDLLEEVKLDQCIKI